jgi:phospholipase/lecithinase/hemolysin
MNGIWMRLWTIGLLAFLVLGGVAGARDWSSLYVFGDSYSDGGAGYADSNGPTAVAYLAQDLGIPFTFAADPHAMGRSLNFAVSGAQTGRSMGIIVRPETEKCGGHEGLFDRGMENQVQDFVQRVKAGVITFNPESTLFFLAGGINDHDPPTEKTVANLEGEVRAIYAAGGRNFLIAVLPMKIPSFSELSARLNPALAKIPAHLRAELKGAHIETSHWGDYYDKVIENPKRYGLTNTTAACAGRAVFGEDATECATPSQYFYYHDGHPSTVTHKVVGEELKLEVARLFP